MLPGNAWNFSRLFLKQILHLQTYHLVAKCVFHIQIKYRDCLNQEIAHKIVEKISQCDEFKVYIFLPSRKSPPAYEIETLRMMYSVIGQAIYQLKSSVHPSDYLNLFTIKELIVSIKRRSKAHQARTLYTRYNFAKVSKAPKCYRENIQPSEEVMTLKEKRFSPIFPEFTS